MSWLYKERAEHMSSYMEYAGADMVEKAQTLLPATNKKEPKAECRIAGLEDNLHFGKHKGRTLEHVINYYPKYIKWLHENSVIQFSKEAIELIQKRRIL